MRSIRVLNTTILDTDESTLLATMNEGVLLTPNVDHLVLLQQNREFYDAYAAAEYHILDSRVLLFLWKIRRESFATNIAGVDLFPRFCDHHRNDPEIRIFILAGEGEEGERVRAMINRKYGREIVTGAYSPTFRFMEDPQEQEVIRQRITASGATVVAAGIGAPKQEIWIYRNRSLLPDVRLFMGVGATFDFMLGKQLRAPRWMQRNGLEWLYRLARDPRRLFRRYLIRDMRFFYYFVQDIVGTYRNPFES